VPGTVEASFFTVGLTVFTVGKSPYGYSVLVTLARTLPRDSRATILS